jgi:GTP-binding protein
VFVDEARITVTGGDGGDGCLSFRREKSVPRGGPDGGDGGEGGSVILVADPSANTLLAFRYKSIFQAERGRHGQGAGKTGRSGGDLEVPVPVGTVVLDEQRGVMLADLATPGQTFVGAKGGRGGRGNARFATSTNRAPRRHEPGAPGESRILKLELKLLADVGLVGLPNAGKSTLISRISAARPKIADYPFTTLSPHLGVVDRGDHRSFVVADIPGLIEGAHLGAGLGHRFLRHVERCRLLLHLVDATGGDPASALRTIDEELRRYNAVLASKPQILVVTKMDAVQDRKPVLSLRRHARAKRIACVEISAVAGTGIDRLIARTGALLDDLSTSDSDRPPDGARTDSRGR